MTDEIGAGRGRSVALVGFGIALIVAIGWSLGREDVAPVLDEVGPDRDDRVVARHREAAIERSGSTVRIDVPPSVEDAETPVADAWPPEGPWVGVRIRLPAPVRGACLAALVPENGRTGRTHIDAMGAMQIEVVARDARAGEGHLLDVFAGDRNFQFVADDVEVELLDEEFVVVDPWIETGWIEVTVAGIDFDIGLQLQVVAHRVSSDDYDFVPQSYERLDFQRHRIGRLAQGRYRVSVAQRNRRFQQVRIDPVEVELGPSGVASAVLKAVRLARLRLEPPSEGMLEIRTFDTEQPVTSAAPGDSHEVWLPCGRYVAVHWWGDDDAHQTRRDVFLEPSGLVLRYR